MSGKIFKDKMGKGGLKKRASYKPGKHPYDLRLVNEIVEKCESPLLGEHDGLVDFIKSAVPKQIDTFEHFDPDAFLEAIVLGWRQNVDYNNLHFALTHSVEALYSAGITAFNLNLHTVPWQFYVMFSLFKGSEGCPITIACKGNFRQFGGGVEYCTLGLEGYAESFGQGAKFSELRLSSQQGAPFASGWGAEDSAYYLQSMKGLPFTVGEPFLAGEGYYVHFKNVKRDSYNPQEFFPISDRCRFHVENFDERLFRQMEKNGFWRCENRLYVPDGKGEWNERIPDGDGWKEVPEG